MQIDMRPVEFITVGTIGPRGKRMFHLQAGHDDRLVSFTLEKEQAWALSEAIQEFIEDLDERLEDETRVEMAALDMDLREPIQPLFRISQMGLGYEEDDGMIILIAQELLIPEDDEDEDAYEDRAEDSGVVRMWCTREQMLALSLHTMDTVEAGRPDPKQNGRIAYYWT
ncbi:MAG: DUF3090 family protein [Aggregatilineales bacterium]